MSRVAPRTWADVKTVSDRATIPEGLWLRCPACEKMIYRKQMEANLSENLESERKSERFTLIEPPLRPETPDSPNRRAILIVGMLLALAGAVGSVVAAETLDNRVRGARTIRDLLTAPPLASIPVIYGDEHVARRSRRRRLAFGVAVGAMLLAAITIHLAYRPLDVLWFGVLRKLGM